MHSGNGNRHVVHDRSNSLPEVQWRNALGVQRDDDGVPGADGNGPALEPAAAFLSNQAGIGAHHVDAAAIGASVDM
jgi:hypothetical protein